jgi:predicted phage terminase large subunit-like protein
MPNSTSSNTSSSRSPWPTLEQVRVEKAKRSFYEYVKQAWHIVEPGTKFVDNWHIKVICDHLQAVTEGKFTRLIINVPPRTLKSTIVSVLWPTWEWGPAGKPHLRYLTASHIEKLATRDAVASRRVISSQWYRSRYGDLVKLTGDQNEKTRYENTKRGYRVSTSVGAGVVGEGGNRIVIDDPHDMLQIFSDVYRMRGLDWWDNAMSTRLNDQAVDAVVLIMQRGHTEDMTGHFLATGEFQHVCLPMEFDGVRRRTVLGEYDIRTKEGELLFERRFPLAVLASLKLALGSYGTAGQLQQQPIPMGGTIFKRDCWQYYKVLPQLEELVLSVDCAFKNFESSDYVAIQAWGRKAVNKYLIDRIKEHLSFAGTVETIRQMKRKYPNAIAILIEDAANGPAVIETLSKEIAGVLPIQPQGGKVARAYAIQPQQEAGNLWLPDPDIAPWIHDYLMELSAFPGAPNDDETDATTQAVTWYELRGGQPSVRAL